MLENLKKQVCEANLMLVSEGLVVHTFGNVSGVDRKSGMMVIKPSGVSYDTLAPEQMVVVSLADGRVAEGKLRPSSDTPTHLELYRAYAQIGGVVHTHSPFATAWAQAGRDLPAYGTTHADYFHGPVPCTRPLRTAEIQGEYEANTGKVIIERLAGIDPLNMPAILVAGHGPFTWGATAAAAVHNAAILEYLASMAAQTERLNPSAAAVTQELLDKHFFRKHGPGKYYGQK
jgi:L-ribulose-5-phosphate 4-epimerase